MCSMDAHVEAYLQGANYCGVCGCDLTVIGAHPQNFRNAPAQIGTSAVERIPIAGLLPSKITGRPTLVAWRGFVAGAIGGSDNTIVSLHFENGTSVAQPVLRSLKHGLASDPFGPVIEDGVLLLSNGPRLSAIDLLAELDSVRSVLELETGHQFCGELGRWDRAIIAVVVDGNGSPSLRRIEPAREDRVVSFTRPWSIVSVREDRAVQPPAVAAIRRVIFNRNVCFVLGDRGVTAWCLGADWSVESIHREFVSGDREMRLFDPDSAVDLGENSILIQLCEDVADAAAGGWFRVRFAPDRRQLIIVPVGNADTRYMVSGGRMFELRDAGDQTIVTACTDAGIPSGAPLRVQGHVERILPAPTGTFVLAQDHGHLLCRFLSPQGNVVWVRTLGVGNAVASLMGMSGGAICWWQETGGAGMPDARLCVSRVSP